VHEGRTQTGCQTAHAGSRLKPLISQEGTAWKASLAAVLGKTRRTLRQEKSFAAAIAFLLKAQADNCSAGEALRSQTSARRSLQCEIF
jgi:hypothetical protein